MNKQRRDQLSEIVGKLEVLKDELEELKEEERECFENLPEGLKYSEKGQQYEENSDDLETACDVPAFSEHPENDTAARTAVRHKAVSFILFIKKFSPFRIRHKIFNISIIISV